jgi:molybdate transport system substrate-binding protein
LADIHVLTGGAPKEVLLELIPEFEKKTGHKAHVAYAVITAIREKLAAGEKPDVVMIPRQVLAAEAKAGIVRDAPRRDLGTVRVGVVVRDGTPKPDISTLVNFKAAVLNATSLVHSNPTATPSGAHLGRVWEKLGLTDAVKAKVTYLSSLDGGVQAIVNGKIETGFYPVSEIISVKGVTLVGLLPDDVQLDTVYAAGVHAGSSAPDAAVAFIDFLADPSNAKHWKDAGFEPAN